MSRFKSKQKSYDKIARKDPEIKKALKYLESVHLTHSFLHSDQSFHFLKTCKKGEYKRYYFYKGNDKTINYIALSFKEINEIQQNFNKKIGDDSYVYLDTVSSKITRNVVHHRFYRLESYGKSIMFMNDEGDILTEDFFKKM